MSSSNLVYTTGTSGTIHFDKYKWDTPLNIINHNELDLTGYNGYVESAEDRNKRLRGLVKKVIFNDDVTVVLWSDGTKTIVRKHEADCYDAEKALLACMAKKLYENTGIFNEVVNEWVDEADICKSDVEDWYHTVELQQEHIDFLEKKIDRLLMVR